MNPIIRNILAVAAGWIAGSVVNMSLINLGYVMLPIQGVDTNNMEQLAKAMPNLGAEHFIFPFLAHALGTLVGALVTYSIAGTQKFKVALIIGALFLMGGIAVSFMLPAPAWFIALDILLAYLPMAWLGASIAKSAFVK